MDNKKLFKRCPRCKSHREENTFYNIKGRLLKTCFKCRDTVKKQRDKNKCEHNRQKNKCKDCGTGYCKHNRLKYTCKDCGTGYCKHNRQKGQCKECGTGHCKHNKQHAHCKKCKDPVKITIKRWLLKCKQTDKKKKIYDRINFIDKIFLKNLVEDINNCVYCKVKLTYEGNRPHNLATIERVNNNKGHIKSNCLLACFKCNNKRSNRYTHEEFKYKFMLKELLNKTKIIN